MIAGSLEFRCDARDHHCGVMMLKVRDGQIELKGRHHGEKHVYRISLREFWKALHDEHPEWLT